MYKYLKIAISLVCILINCAAIVPHALAQGNSPPPGLVIRYLCLPHPNAPGANPPSVSDVRKFCQTYAGILENSEQELLLDLEFGRWVTGQTQILADAIAFQKAHTGYKMKVRFLQPAEWFDQLVTEYRHVGSNEALVVQIGDSWEKYFVSEGMLSNFGTDKNPMYTKRYFYDVRLVWYWKKYIKPTDLSDGNSLLTAVRRVRDKDNMIPLAIPRSRDFDLFWNFYVWLNAANGKLVSIGTQWHLIPWVEATISGNEGRNAVGFLSDLAEEGALALPETSNVQVTQDFLNGNYAMCVMEPWVAWRAKAKLGEKWSEQIGASLLPDLSDTGSRKTFVGGYLLGIMAPNRKAGVPTVDAAKEWIDYLTNEIDPSGHLRSLQFIPATDKVWEESEFKPFFDKALGRENASLPSNLEKLRTTWSPPVLAEGPKALETEEVLSHIASLWHGLERIHNTDPFDTPQDLIHRRKLVTEALIRTQEAMNINLSPGYFARQLWWILIVLLLVIALISYITWHQICQWKWRVALRERREEIADMKRGLRETLISQSAQEPDSLNNEHHGESSFDEDLAKLRDLIRQGKFSLLE